MLRSNKYGRKEEHWNTELKCLVVTIKSVVAKEYIENGVLLGGVLLVPTEDIVMSCPLDKANEPVV